MRHPGYSSRSLQTRKILNDQPKAQRALDPAQSDQSRATNPHRSTHSDPQRSVYSDRLAATNAQQLTTSINSETNPATHSEPFTTTSLLYKVQVVLYTGTQRMDAGYQGVGGTGSGTWKMVK